MTTHMIPSTIPGHVWATVVYNGNRGIVVSASDAIPHEDGRGFTVEDLFCGKRHTMGYPGKRLTKGVEAKALQAFTAHLIAEGVCPGATPA